MLLLIICEKRTPFMHIYDLNSTEGLAKYLLKISENHELFASYFWWREHYKIEVFDAISKERLLSF